MRSFTSLLRCQLRDTFRSRPVLGYALALLLLTDALFRFGGRRFAFFGLDFVALRGLVVAFAIHPSCRFECTSRLA